jgi:hypothetical protein
VNIFYISEDPKQCAEWMVDRHVIKMLTESAQLLSTAHRLLDGVQYIGQSKSGRKAKRWRLPDSREDIMYSATHINHPSAVWARTSVENYNWLVDHFFALGAEYTHRYGKRHSTIEKLGYQLQSPPFNLKAWDWTPMPSCMDKEYIISDDPILNYRNYYINAKKHLHAWKRREAPDWITSEELELA